VAARCAFPRGLVVVTGGSGYIAGGTVTRTEFGSANLQFPVRAQAAVAARHVRNASSRRTRSVWRDVRWRWTLNVLWTAA
jgi:hypothetical protein